MRSRVPRLLRRRGGYLPSRARSARGGLSALVYTGGVYEKELYASATKAARLRVYLPPARALPGVASLLLCTRACMRRSCMPRLRG